VWKVETELAYSCDIGKAGDEYRPSFQRASLVQVMSTYGKGVTPDSRTKPFGADPVQDFTCANIGHSAYFSGV
jgi:hypothetical protein